MKGLVLNFLFDGTLPESCDSLFFNCWWLQMTPTSLAAIPKSLVLVVTLAACLGGVSSHCFEAHLDFSQGWKEDWWHWYMRNKILWRLMRQYRIQQVHFGGKAARIAVSVSAAKLGLSCKAFGGWSFPRESLGMRWVHGESRGFVFYIPSSQLSLALLALLWPVGESSLATAGAAH